MTYLRSALLLISLLAGLAVVPSPQQQSTALVGRVPVQCKGPSVTTCSYPPINPGMSGFVIAQQAEGGRIVDSVGDVWTQDQCNPYDNGDCIFSTRFKNTVTSGITLNFSGANFTNVYLVQYEQQWSFTGGNYGVYGPVFNAPFPECVNNNGSCAYGWTLPVEADPGRLCISWANQNGTGALLAKPGFGWYIEASDGFFAFEDMITPIEGPYFGALTWKRADGGDNGGTHWLEGIACYAR